MAKKKTKKIAAEKSANVGYSGSVCVSVKSGDRTLSRKTYHNTGGGALFLYLCNCLKDGGGSASSLFPNKVKLFTVDETRYDKPSGASAELIKSENYGPAMTFDSLGITGSSRFVAESDVGTASGNKITLSFRIPYAYITESKINMIGLYGRGVTADGY